MEEARPTQDSEYMKKYYQGEDEREGGLSLVEKAGLGILTGVAGYAIARRTGLGHRFGQFIERDVKSYGQGIKEAIDRSPIPKLNGTNTDFTRIANQMKKDFQKGQKDFKETYDKKRAKLERREMDMERMIRQFTEITGKKNTSDGYMYTLIDDSMRYKRMVEEIKKSKNKQINQHQSEIIKAVQSMNPNSIKRMSNKDFATHLRKNGIKDKALIGQVESVRMKTNSFNYLGKKDKQTIAMMNNNRKEMQNLFVQETKDLIKQNKFKNAVGGGELATVEDVLRLNASKKSKKFKLSDETVDFLNEAIKIDNSFKHAVFDRNLVIKKNKKKKTETVEDYNIYKDIKRKSLDWFSGTMPGGILHARDLSNILEGRDLFHTYVMRRGTQQPTINAQMGKENQEYLDEHVIKIGGKVVRAADERTLIDQKPLEILNPKRDIYLTSSMYGSIPRMVRHVGETMTENDTPYNNKMFEILDIGKQDKDNNFHKVTSIFSKFFDEDWTRNWAVNVMNQGLKDSEDYHRMNSFFRWNSKPLSNRTFHALNGQYDSLVQNKINDLGINFSKDEDYIRLFEELGQKELEKKGSISDLGSVYKKYKSDPERFLKQKTPYGESSFIMGDQNMTRTGFDDIKVSLSGHLIGSAQRKIYYENPDLNMEQSMENIRSIFDDFYERGAISRSDYIGSQEAVNYKLFQQAGANINRATASAIVKTNELFNDTRFYNTAMNTVKRGNPIWESTVKTKPENTTEDVMIAVNKSDVFSNMMGVLDSSKSVGERFKSFIDPFTQLSGGRDRMEDFTTLSMIPYYAGYRLQDMLGTIGLGLSDKSMGSSVQIASSLFMKRLLPAYMGVETYKYADYKMDQWTGEGIDERYQNMIANGRLDDAYDMTDEERQEELHKKQLKPGLEHWEAMPEVTLPFFGSIGMGHVANSVSNIFFADTDLEANSAMTPDEVVDDLYKGEEEVRKSRWWTAGSKSAYRGDRISEFAPNAFRQAHSDWEWSGTGLTGEEYFSTRLYPTLENPLGILGQMIGTVDPYTFENKHMEDRPYLLTGELFNPNTMFFGDVLNRTLGQSIKPVQQMHSEYWGTPSSVQEQTDNETDNSKRIRDTPITTQISPGGRMKNVIYGTPDDYGGYNDRQATGEMSPNIVAYNHERGRFITSNQKDAQGFSTGGMMLHDLSDNTTAYVPASVAKSGMSYSDIKDYAQTNTDTSKYIQYDGSPNYTQTYSAQVSTAPRAMYDEDYAYKNELRNRKLNNVYDPRTKEWGAQEFVENWSEPLGVYKWLFNDELLGYDPYSNKMVMEKADAATNFSDTFWESNLGSLGAEYSEFARRFIRRDDGNLDFYNPIENTMPDWLPGSNYFINFQSGDPYTKVDHGERRLPGAGYESLNELHPDEFGDYGAFDRFKILGDVAPWSDEYKYWSQFLMDNLEDEDLRKEATEIRHQVSDRKAKYDFQKYRFKDNDVDWYDVKVDKILDGTTFKSKEFGEQAIRLAGVDHHQNPKGLLDAYLDEGQTVRIGIAKDESKRISKDTYKTMNAVILDGTNNINQDIIRQGYMRENENDFSAPGIQSRFTKSEISQGKRWETMAHADNPFNTKFLQVRTAVEEYERDQIYGKDWATWQNLAIRDYLMPTLEGLGRRDGVLESAALGGMFGYTMGIFLLHGGRERKMATALGALIGVASNIGMRTYEKNHGEKWKPERRRVEEDINEYFDFLDYTKYSGLYENAREEILHQTGVDTEDLVGQVNEKKQHHKELKKELERERKQLYLEQPKGWEKRKKEINQQIKQMGEDGKVELELPDYIVKALQYREKRDTTIYGIDPTQDLMQVQKAMPYKDKWFFMEFVNATDSEKEELMKILPQNQKRIYNAIWTHQNTEAPPPPEYFFSKYGGVPDEYWEGWRSDIDLKDVKAQVVKEAGLDLTDFGLWQDDLYNKPYVPSLQPEGGNNIYEAKDFKGYGVMEDNLYKAMQGAGIYDARIVVSPNDTGITNVNINIEEDRTKEVSDNLYYNRDEYI